MSAARPKAENRYVAIIEKIFFDHWKKGSKAFEFDRTEIKQLPVAIEPAAPPALHLQLFGATLMRNYADWSCDQIRY